IQLRFAGRPLPIAGFPASIGALAPPRTAAETLSPSTMCLSSRNLGLGSRPSRRPLEHLGVTGLPEMDGSTRFRPQWYTRFLKIGSSFKKSFERIFKRGQDRRRLS